MVFGTAISGMQAAMQDLEVTGNNIANSSTYGFKGSRAEFADVYSAGTYGGGNNSIGSGVRLASVQQVFGQGQFEYTNNGLDIGIQGTGFFVISDQGAHIYTRAGSFHDDKQGFIVNSSNQRLQGFMADVNGNIGATISDLQINKADILPKATSYLKTGLNLYSNAEPPSIAWAGGITPAPDSYNNQCTTNIFDSLGNTHVLTMYFIHADGNAAAGSSNASSPAGEYNEWYVAFQIDNKNVPDDTGTTNAENLYRVNFNPDGSFAGVYGLSDQPLPNNYISLTMEAKNGSDPLTFNVDLSNCTQMGSPFGVQSQEQNGYTTGQLSGLNISPDGVLLGSYTNGQARAMGQLVLANFANQNGLQNLSNTSWSETYASGQPLLGIAGTAGLGLLQSGALEISNVDLTNELVNLIGAQRDFQANAQTIRTADAVAQSIINIR